MRKVTLLTITILVSLFVFSSAHAAVTFKMTFVDNYNDDSIPTVNPGNNFTCYFWIDPGGLTIDGFSLCVSYPENKIVPTNVSSPFTDASYISNPSIMSNKRTEVGSGDDKIDFTIVTFTGSGTGAIGKFQSITGLPESGEIQWCGVGSPDPDTSAETKYSVGGNSYTPDTHPDTSLPVQLSLFTANSTNNGVKLVWRTETEINNVGFSIHRSEEKDGNYTRIAFIEGAGNSGMPKDYQFTDKNVDLCKTYFYYLEDIDIFGEKSKSKIIKVIVSSDPLAKLIPKDFRLLQNYPNPFNPETWIPYQLAHPAEVTITIYNIHGKRVRKFDFQRQPAGWYHSKGKAACWNGRNDAGEAVASGVYFYTIQIRDGVSEEITATRKMLMLK
jgi:hypothetical protein